MVDQNKEVRRWGVDFGNVLVQNLSDEQEAEVIKMYIADDGVKSLMAIEKFLLENSKLMPDALVGLRRLITNNGAENIFIVSRASVEQAIINGILFRLHKILERTGFLIENIYVCEKRSDKVDICKKLDIVSHIDDRGEVLSYMCGQIPHLVWFAPTKKDLERWSIVLGTDVVRVNGWADLIPLLGWL